MHRSTDNSIEIILVAVRNRKIWCLPKGIIEKGEKPEDTCIREVREETGLAGRVLEKIGDIFYWYYNKKDNAKCRKTVHFYLLEHLGGNTAHHDNEVDAAEWFSIKEALAKMTYKGEKDIVLKAGEMLLKKAAGGK